MKLVVGITGSTGVIYGIRLLEVLKEKGIETNLVMSEWAKKCVPMETKHDVAYVESLATEVTDETNSWNYWKYWCHLWHPFTRGSKRKRD